MIFNQAHAPFGGGFEVYTKQTIPKMPRVFEFASLLGVKQIIVHPAQKIPYLGREEEMFEINMELYSSLAPYAKNCGIKIAIENMWQNRPVTGYICDDVCRALTDIKYQGDFTLEADCFLAQYEHSLRPAAAKFMAEVAKHLVGKIESYMAE